MADDDGADKAIRELNGKRVDAKEIKVDYARGYRSRNGGSSGRYGGWGGRTRNFSSRQQSGQTHQSDRGQGLSSSNTGGFQGSIDIWNNPGDTGSGNSSSSAAGDGGHESGEHRGYVLG